ncbi:hypothetical protein R0137_17020 [Congregibacter brevis]|uniref:Uncharacterized protein n=1 Tax=Congregibacter brevis TaxID=3081201 RepID=A0ABZ0IBN2_9GAMM|nr:hypothetical protein R0137_17020 [Congregibacter sp. IMCC45268]
MTDDLSYSYSHSTPTGQDPAAAEPAASAPLVAFADCELIGVDAQKMLVINRVNGKQQFIAPPVVEALKTCTQFDTVANHTKRLCATRPELKGQEAGVSSTLQQLADSGFLLLGENIRKRLVDAPARTLAPSRVFIITCDRPAAVERLLESMLRSGNLSRHEGLYLVDDSRTEENRSANRDLVETFNMRSAKDMQYFGVDEQLVLQNKLVDALPEHEQGIRFLIDPEQWVGYKTYGRSRTLALLLSVGYRAIVLDDDVTCQAVLPPVREEGVSFTGQRQAAFYPDRETLISQGNPADFDPLSGHLQYLGQSLGHSLKELAGGEIDTEWLSQTNAAMLNVLDPESPVLVTQCGSWGDPGTGGAHWGLSLDERSIERLVSAPHGMVKAVENRCNWLGCPRPTLHKMAFMSQMTGIDNTHLLPPYFPAFRGEDLLFGTMIETMYHHGAVLEYGWSVPHLPLDDRNMSIRDPIAGEGGIVLFSRYMTENIDYKDASDPERRLRNMAEDARRMAARSDEDLLLDYRTEQAKAQAHGLFQVTAQAAKASELESINWQSYLQRGLDEIEQSMNEEHSPTRITGVPDGVGASELLSQFRSIALGWAAAIEAWPEIRSTVAEQYLKRAGAL